MKKLLSVILFSLALSGYLLVYGASVGNELSQGVVRFHILANSDSQPDQKIKLAVRDYVSASLKDGKVSTEAVERLANEYLSENKIGYSATATRERVFIPKKSYKNITMPSGYYDAIRLSLGNGEGENWWCVAYPSLCFTESFSGELSEDAQKMLSDRISAESLSVITGKREYRLFIVDMVGKILNKI